MSEFRRCLFLFLLLTAWLLRGTPAEVILDRAEKESRKTRSLAASFTQTKTIPFVRQKIVLSGTLRMDGERLFWRTLSPIRSTFCAEKGKYRFWDEGSDKVVTLDPEKIPGMDFLAGMMQGTISGRKEIWIGLFSVHSCKDALSVRLVPHPETPLAGMIRDITLVFAPDFSCVRQVTVQETGGSVTVTDFHDIVRNRPIPEKELLLP